MKNVDKNSNKKPHYIDVIMGTMVSQITTLIIVYSTVYSGADQRKHQSSASLAFVWGIHRGPVNSRHKWPVTRKISPFDDVIMTSFSDVPSRRSDTVPNVPYRPQQRELVASRLWSAYKGRKSHNM